MMLVVRHLLFSGQLGCARQLHSFSGIYIYIYTQMMAYNNGKTSSEKMMSRAGIEPTTLRLHVWLRYHYTIETTPLATESLSGFVVY